MSKTRFSARALCVPMLLFALHAALADKRSDWNKPVQPFHIIGPVYYVGTAGLGAYLIHTPQGNILLDGALPESAAQIEQHVAALGFRMQDVKILLNTHAHYDHAGGLHALKEASHAQMVASRADAADLESGLTESYGAGWDSHSPGVKVDRIINDGDHVTLGGVTLTAHLTPGHTKGCTTWTMPATEDGRTYQVLFYCSTSVPGYPLVHNRAYPTIASDYQHTFATLETLHPDVFLANHTELFHMQEKLARLRPGAPNPFIDPAEFPAAVRESKRDFEQKLKLQQTAAVHNHH